MFVPWEYVFSYKNPAATGAYNLLGQFAFWKIATRLSYRAEIFSGAAQMIVDALGTDHIPSGSSNGGGGRSVLGYPKGHYVLGSRERVVD